MSGVSDTGKVTFAKLLAGPQLSLRGADAELRDALQPRAAFPRSGREWKVGELFSRGARLIGQFGYLSEENSEFYDSEDSRYRTARLQVATSGRFALDTESLDLVFQVKTPRVTDTSYLGALRHLLRWQIGADWDAELATLSGRFSEWADSVMRISGITFGFDLRRIDEDAYSELFRFLVNNRAETLILRSPTDPEGVNIRSTIIRQGLALVESGGGEATAQGTRLGDDDEVLRCSWASKLGGEKLTIGLPVDGEGNIPYELLLDALTEVPTD